MYDGTTLFLNLSNKVCALVSNASTNCKIGNGSNEDSKFIPSLSSNVVKHSSLKDLKRFTCDTRVSFVLILLILMPLFAKVSCGLFCQ